MTALQVADQKAQRPAPFGTGRWYLDLRTARRAWGALQPGVPIENQAADKAAEEPVSMFMRRRSLPRERDRRDFMVPTGTRWRAATISCACSLMARSWIFLISE